MAILAFPAAAAESQHQQAAQPESGRSSPAPHGEQAMSQMYLPYGDAEDALFEIGLWVADAARSFSAQQAQQRSTTASTTARPSMLERLVGSLLHPHH